MVSAWYARAHLRSLLVGPVFAAVSTLTVPVWALEPSIWYRAGEGCPDGASFLERLERRSVRGRLAAVGDQVDFVVTLGAQGQQSSGRLERQTSGGTIAIREVQHVSCAAVADVLALTLALTLDPAAQSVPTAEPAPTGEAGAPGEAGATGETGPPLVDAAQPRPESPSPRPGATAAVASERPAAVPPPDAAVRGGVAVAAWDLFEGPWLFEAGPFAEIEASESFVLPRATLRLALQGGLRPDADASARVWLTAARLEACPLAVGRATLSLRPCGAVDVGAIRASAEGVSDTALWSAVAAHARFRFERGRLGLEAQAGGIVPLTRYEMTTAGSGATLEKTREIGFAGGIGVSVRFE